MIGELHRIVGRQAHNRNGIVTAQSVTGEQRSFTKAHFKLFDVCASRQLKAAIGEKLLSRSGSKKGQVINGERLTVAGWDERGNPISSDGRTISHRNLCHAYASTVRKVQGSSATKVIVGFDRLSVKSATQDAAYVASSRGREFCQVHVESIADLSQIQNRSGDRKAATEMPVEKLTTQLQAIVDQTEKARRSKLLTVPQTFKSTPAAQRCTNCNPGNTLAAGMREWNGRRNRAALNMNKRIDYKGSLMIELIVIFLIFWILKTMSARSKKRRGEIIGPDGKKYELWDKDWENEPRPGDNCNADGEPYYRGPDGKPYIKGSDGKFW